MRLKSFIQKTGPDGTITVACFTCAHCQKIVEVPKGAAMGFCHKCFYPTCLACGGSERCSPFEKKIEKFEQRDRMLRSMGIC